MTLPRRQQVSDALHLIAALIQEADSYLREGLFFDAPTLKAPKMKDGPEPYAGDFAKNAERRLAAKASPPARKLLRARTERKARSRYATLKNVTAPPRKVLGSRLRTR